MPKIVRLRNVSGQDLSVGPLGGRVVKDDHIVDIPEDLHRSRAWPEATWKLEKFEGGK